MGYAAINGLGKLKETLGYARSLLHNLEKVYF